MKMDQNLPVLERIIRLDGVSMTDRETTHSYLKFKFYFPTHYGKNLDALYDQLTEIGEPTKIIIYHVDELKQNQPDYGRSMLKVFRAAEDANPKLTIRFIEGERSEPRVYKIRMKKSEPILSDRPIE